MRLLALDRVDDVPELDDATILDSEEVVVRDRSAELALSTDEGELAFGDDLVYTLVDQGLAVLGPGRGGGAEACEAVGCLGVVLQIGLGGDVVSQD